MNKVNKQVHSMCPTTALQVVNNPSLKVNLKNGGFLSLEPGEIVEAGNIMLLEGNNRVVSYPVVLGNPVFVNEAYNSTQTQEGILIISELILEKGELQEIIQYGTEKPRVLLHVGGVMQFIMQPVTYLAGRTKIDLEWEFSTSPVPLRTMLRVG